MVRVAYSYGTNIIITAAAAAAAATNRTDTATLMDIEIFMPLSNVEINCVKCKNYHRIDA